MSKIRAKSPKHIERVDKKGNFNMLTNEIMAKLEEMNNRNTTIEQK